ncbi:BatD [hydrothermal vent metagenome]|uniref:BatD n=1 Tax=hydrothermal vent metagenome TaxID=652676 RepID=A0A1W1BGB0_9ZZZZ
MKLILGSILLFFTLLNAGSVEAEVDSDEVFPGDSVVLTISVVGENIKSLPNISSVGGVQVINSSRRSSSSFTSANGKAKMEITESLMLEFVPEQNMTIPSFQVKVDGKIESSEPIKISVNPLKKRTVSSENFALDMELSKTEAFVGEPIIVTVKFRQKRNINILDIEYQQPKFKGFFSKMIGKQRNYNKGQYSYMELRYLLIAKQDGEVRVDPARAKIAVSSGRRGLWFSDRAKWSNLITDSPLINIKKPNGDFDIVGNYSLEDSVDTKEVEANKPVNLKIVLDGEGSLDDYEGMEFELAGVTLYSDDAKIDNKLVRDELRSRYTKQFVFISDHDFTIPSRTIRVYNYKTEEINELRTKEYHIKVKGSSKESVPAVYTKNRVDTNDNSEIKQKSTYKVNWDIPSWFMLLGAFILGIVATIVGQRFLPSFGKFRPQFSISRDEALTVLYPKMSESAEVEEMVRKLYDVKQGKKVNIDKSELKRLVEKYS